MSQANELLNGITSGVVTYTSNPETEPHIIIDSNRNIIVPEELREIAVQYDHNVETVTFDCPRYWDGHDFSTMVVYINYACPNGISGTYPADNVRVDELDSSMIHFEWTISKNVTMYKGNISFLVCIKTTDENANEDLHWNSELNSDLCVLEGLECEKVIEEKYPDLYTRLIERMDGITERMDNVEIYEYERENQIWKKAVSVTDEKLYSVAYGNGMFVAVGNNSTICYSTDGVTWFNNNVSTINSSNAIAFGNGKFVTFFGGISYYSKDGITWTKGEDIGVNSVWSIAYGKDKFVAFSENGGSYYSTDGVTWIKNDKVGMNTLYSVTYGDGKFVAVGISPEVPSIPPSYGVTYFSNDGIIWTAGQTIDDNQGLKSVAYGNGKFIAVGYKGAIYYSTNGATWSRESTAGDSVYLNSIIYGNYKFLAVDHDGVIYYSTDEETWISEGKISDDELLSIVYGNSRFIAVGRNGAIYYFKDVEKIKSLEEAINNLYSTIEETKNYLIDYVDKKFAELQNGGAE